MKFIPEGLSGIVLVPENRQEAQLLKLWSLSKSVSAGLTDCNQWWMGQQLSISFDMESAEAVRQEMIKSIKIDPLAQYDSEWLRRKSS